MQALEVAKYFVELHRNVIDTIQNDDTIFENEPITHLKIQKLLYYAQGLGLVYLNKPLFSEKIEAWKHGPVVREVYEALREYGKRDLQDVLKYENTLNVEEQSIVEMAFREYGRYTASYLRNKTHAEPLWKNAYKDKNNIISEEAMRDFFKKEQRRKAEILYLSSKEYRCLFN